MPPGDFPEEVRRFILDHISSVEQLEVLLLLKGSAPREWTAKAVSQALYTQPEAAAMRLADLQTRGLLAVREGPERQYNYLPGTPELAGTVNRLAEVYRERRVTVITMIYSKPSSPVQAFADAFRLRKEK